MGDSEATGPSSTAGGSSGTAVDALGYLTRSAFRIEMLLTIDAEDPIDGHELRERFDVARTTITRTLDGFDDRGWIRRQGGTCSVTAFGASVAATVKDAVADLEPAVKLAPFLERVPAESFDLDPDALADASITVAEPGSPYAPVERVTELRQGSRTVRELSSIVARDSAEQVHDRAVTGDATFEIVLQEDVIDQIHGSAAYREQFERTVAQEGVEVRVYEGTFPFLVVLLDDVVALGVTNEEALPAALVVSEDSTVRAWAEERYEEYYSAARPYESLGE